MAAGFRRSKSNGAKKKMENKNKEIFFFILILLAANAVSFFVWVNSARAESSCNNHVIISQIYGGGGNSGAIYKNDFIELYNPTGNNVSIDNWSVQYASATGLFSSANTTNLSGTIKAKSYYLIAEAKGSGGTDDLPTPDMSGGISLATDKGKVALVDNIEAISNKNDDNVVDFVGYGSTANDYEGAAAAPPPSNTQSIIRYQSCLDSDDNKTDFKKTSPSPRNSNVIEKDEEESQSNDDITQDESENNDNNEQDPSEKCAASSKDIKLNELFPYPETGGQEFVELKNFGAYCVDLSDWKIVDEKGNKYVFAPGTIVGPKEIWHANGNFYLNNTTAETVYLLDSSGKEVDKTSYEKAVKKYSFSSDGQEFFWTSVPTPGTENIFDAAEDENEENGNNSDSAGSETAGAATNENVYLNEILPNPKGGSGNEYIEIASGESKPVDLFDWRIKDGSKSKGYQFKEHIVLESGEYFAIYHSDSKIALNNSDESVYLYNPKGEVASSATFDKSQKNASFNFDGEKWKWSKYLTPGKKNKFDSEPSVKIKKPKNVFKDIFADFSAKAKDKETKNLKYAWDFGDGKKSYLAKTSHKYLATGKYAVTLSVTDDSQTIKKSFTINVKKYPRPDLEIVKVVPNPAGSDSDGETVDIKNNSGGKFNLTGWKIATGSDGKMNNHLISGEINLDPNETKTITREMCKFSLNNKAGKIQLVMPDGKVIDEVEYQKEKIADDEAYVKINDGWRWIAPNTPANTEDPEETDDSGDIQDEKSEEHPDGEILGAADENAPYHAPLQTGYTPEDEFIFYKLFGLLNYKPREANYCPVNQLSTTFAYF